MAAATPRCPTPRPSSVGISADGRRRAASGRGRYRPGLEHRDRPDLPPTRSACRSRPIRLSGADTAHHARCRQDLGLAPDLRLRQGGRKGRPGAARSDPALRQCLGEAPRSRSTARRWSSREGEATRRIDLAALPADRRRLRLRGARRPTIRRPRRSTPRARASPMRVYGYGAQIAELEVDMRLGTVQADQDHRRARCRPRDQPAAGRGPDRGRHRAGHRHGADGGIHPRPHREPARLSDPDHRRRAADRDASWSRCPIPKGPFGAKGLGEHVLIPTAPAILNAIRHATGVLVTKVPATPSRIRAAIRDSGGTRDERAFRTLRNPRSRRKAGGGEDPLRCLPGDVLHRRRPHRRLRPLRQCRRPDRAAAIR